MTKSGSSRLWRKSAAVVLVILYCANGPRAAGVSAVYRRTTPMVVDVSSPENVRLEVKVEGKPTAVTLMLASSGIEVLMRDDGNLADKVAGDGVYTVIVAVRDILHNFTPDDVYRNFIGYVRPYVGKERVGQWNVFFDILTDDVPPVQIRRVAHDIQCTKHLVNIVFPQFFEDFLRSAVCGRFYEEFDDDYDFINLIYEVSYFQNRFHANIRNDVTGIGMTVFDGSASYGSDGRLMGITVFPIPGFFDGAGPSYQHELGHQWINWLIVPPLDYAIPHWPLSDLASGIMGWAMGLGGQGLHFNFDLVPDDGDYLLVPDYKAKDFTDLALYLIGLIGRDEVGEHFVFDDQDQSPSAGILHGPVTTVRIDDIISQAGPRVPDYTISQKVFNVATIIISKERFVSADTMRLYDYFSARAAGREIVPYSSGFAKGMAKPFYLSTRRMGQLDVRIKGPEKICDFVQDSHIDLRDVLFMADRWLDRCRTPDWCDGADIDHSRTVDSQDFASCAEYYGF
ncbi:MAG: hypothetical protein JSU70_21280 [Phycisphaerales bacterium]|nr:MAG: hypothetical protein JSU70_21280 [Phycisphaerales bacterium]